MPARPATRRRYCITRHLGLVTWRQLGLASETTGVWIVKFQFAVSPRFCHKHPQICFLCWIKSRPHQRQCRQKPRHCRRNRRQCRRNRRHCRHSPVHTSDIVAETAATIRQHCCQKHNVAGFGDIVAGVDGALGLPYVRVFPHTSSFWASVRAGFRQSAVCRGFWRPNPQVYSNVADSTRQRKLVSFQYKMSVTSQNAKLVQASCTCLLNTSKRCAHH